ncbi:hypothetical protein lerEdw1_005086, partial [Lerista edwardsae]
MLAHCLFQDPILRRSGMYTVAMAYCGSGNNKAIRRLLHVAVSTVDNGIVAQFTCGSLLGKSVQVSDVNDDVRRAAVESLGFILFRRDSSAQLQENSADTFHQELPKLELYVKSRYEYLGSI